MRMLSPTPSQSLWSRETDGAAWPCPWARVIKMLSQPGEYPTTRPRFLSGAAAGKSLTRRSVPWCESSRRSACPRAEREAADGRENDDERDVGHRLLRPEVGVDDEHARERERRPREKQGQRRPLPHPRTEKALQDRDLRQRGEIHERAKHRGDEIRSERIAAYEGGDRRVGDDPRVAPGPPHQPPGDEYASEKKRQDLFGELPCPEDPFPALVPVEPPHDHEEERPRGEGRERKMHLPDGREEPDGAVRGAPVDEDEKGHHRAEKRRVLPWLASRWDVAGAGRREGIGAARDARGFLLPEQERHQEPDDDREPDGTDDPGDAQLEAEDARRQDHREDVDRRPRIEKRGRRPEPRPAPVDAGEERKHGARADGENRTRYRRDAVGDRPRRPGAEVAHHGGLAQELPDGPGDEKSRNKAEKNVLPRVVLQEEEAFEERPLKPRALDGKQVRRREDGDDQEQLRPLLHRQGSRLLRRPRGACGSRPPSGCGPKGRPCRRRRRPAWRGGPARSFCPSTRPFRLRPTDGRSRRRAARRGTSPCSGRTPGPGSRSSCARSLS